MSHIRSTMTDRPASRTYYPTRLTLDLEIPLGVTTWAFSKHADEEGLVVSQLVPVTKATEPADRS
jgi:hypothetical protein